MGYKEHHKARKSAKYRFEKKHLWGMIVFLVVFLGDQASKSWILYGLKLPEKGTIPIFPCLNFTMVWNHAVTFGMFGGHSPWLFIIVSMLAILILLNVLLRTEIWLVALAAGAIIGGALGNVVDRCLYGAVVDFLDLYISNWHWYVFNLADSAIVCGVGLWMLEVFLAERQRDKSLEKTSLLESEQKEGEI